MNDAEKAIIAGLEDSAKAAVKALLKEIVDKDLPAIEAAEVAKLPAGYGPVVNVVFASAYPSLAKLLDAKIDSI